MKMAILLVASGILGLAGCQSSPVATAQDTCSVAVPSDIKTDPKTAAEAAIDLTKLAKLPLSANLKFEVSNAFSATFQKVPDTIAACAMLNQTYVCIKDSERAKAFMDFMRESKQCVKS